ncbi:VWA domain-containing protein [Brevundimonas intermedia]|uniref:VWA domain-containing protein n=1 Tax=Brevundimonas intermedia TaxID=74315 RepID=A0ABQ5T8H2_9CAUL|nr:VWA domain-containing protein [Brevundimonas intermedia]GLK48329.1 VWA domain-containing protein [Brevundimonas intermedia]
MTLTFLHPEAGWLLLLIPGFVWWARKAARMRVGLRTVVFLALVAALAQPSLIVRRGGSTSVIIVDQGAALSPASRAQAVSAAQSVLARAERNGPVVVIQRGGAPLALKATRHVTLPDGGETGGLPHALNLALAAFPLGSEGRVTMIGDGLGADRAWGRSVDALLARGVVVDSVPISAGRRDAFIADVAIPPVRAGERVSVRVRLDGAGQDMSLAVFSGDRRLGGAGPFDLDGTVGVALDVPVDKSGFMPLRVELMRGGAVVSVFETAAAVQDPLPILYVDGRQTGGAAALQRLAGQGLRIDSQAPAALAAVDLSAYRAVLLDDVPASALPAPSQHRLIEAVRTQGLGLMVSGGDSAFAAGGYAGSPLSAALPVTIRQEVQTEDPSVAVAVVIDTSGSMLGAPLELGKQVARLAVRKLTPADSVGVVEFYGGRQWVAPMQPARDIPEVERAIGRVQAQGGSEHLFGALQEAYYGLQNTQARYRHILVISDAGVNADRYPQLIRHIAQDQVTVSTVLVGGSPEGEARMAQWARLGRGRFYVVSDEFSLVEINLKQPQQKPQPGVKRGGFVLAASAPSYGWGGLAAAPPRQLDGYAQAGVKPPAETLIRTTAGEPVLASWQWGAGRVTALMTEPVGAGTANWRAWSGYGDWIQGLIARTADPRPEWDVRLGRVGDRLKIVAQRIRGGDGDAPQIRLLNPAGQAGPALSAVERAPGLFTVEGGAPADAPAQVEVRDGRGVTRAALAAIAGGQADRPVSETDGLPLDQLARLTGGTVIEDPSRVGAVVPPPARSPASALDLWGWLCWLALALYVVDIVYRRWPPRRIAV